MPLSTGPVDARPHRTESVDRRPRPHLLRVLLVAAFAFVALLGWSFASPVGASPDDNFHMTSIWCAPGERPGICEETGDPGERAILSEVANSSVCFAFVPEHSGRCDSELSGLITTGHGNFEGLYPPVYYGTMSIFSSTDVQTSVLLMRVFNSLLAVSLVTSIYLLVDRRLRAPMLGGLLLTAVPAAIFLVASVNPSGWAIMSAGTLWVALVGWFRAPTLTRRIALAGLAAVSALMGAGSRGDSAVYVAFGALVAAILCFEKSRRYLLSALLPIAVIVLGAAFYLSSNQVGSALEGEMAGVRPENVNVVSGLIRTVMNIPQLWVGNFGTQALGWGDTKMPAIVWFLALILYAGVAFWALGRRRGRRSTVAVVLAAIALVMVPSWVIVQNGVDVGVLVQPRYVLPLLVLFLGLLLFDAPDMRDRMSPTQKWAIVIGLSVANATALYTTLRRYLTGTDYAGFDLNNGIEWWWNSMPVPPGVFWILGSIAFAALLACAMGTLGRPRPLVVDRSAGRPLSDDR